MDSRIIRINVLKANFDKMGGAFHRMHCMVHITVNYEGEKLWVSGLAESSGHKPEWKDKHYDILSSKAALTMNIAGMDYDKKHVAHLIGEVELSVGTFLIPGEKTIEVFQKDKLGNSKEAGHIVILSEFIQK
jgi:hypothetical protein